MPLPATQIHPDKENADAGTRDSEAESDRGIWGEADPLTQRP